MSCDPTYTVTIRHPNGDTREYAVPRRDVAGWIAGVNLKPGGASYITHDRKLHEVPVRRFHTPRTATRRIDLKRSTPDQIRAAASRDPNNAAELLALLGAPS